MALTLAKPGNRLAGLLPAIHHKIYATWRFTAVQLGKQLFTSGLVPLRDDVYPAVACVRGISGQAEFKGAGSHPPAEPDSLDMSVHPGVKADLRTQY